MIRSYRGRLRVQTGFLAVRQKTDVKNPEEVCTLQLRQKSRCDLRQGFLLPYYALSFKRSRQSESDYRSFLPFFFCRIIDKRRLEYKRTLRMKAVRNIRNTVLHEVKVGSKHCACSSLGRGNCT